MLKPALVEVVGYLVELRNGVEPNSHWSAPMFVPPQQILQMDARFYRVVRILTDASKANDFKKSVKAMTHMLQSNEWAEHAGTCDDSNALEHEITRLHNSIHEAEDRAQKAEEEMNKAIEFLQGQVDGLTMLLTEREHALKLAVASMCYVTQAHPKFRDVLAMINNVICLRTFTSPARDKEGDEPFPLEIRAIIESLPERVQGKPK